MNLLKAADKSAQKLLELVARDFPCFQDVATLEDGTKVSIYKRAQIFVADLNSLFENQGIAEFSDMDTITMFGDYRVPQSLQYFGCFHYTQVSKISNRVINNLNYRLLIGVEEHIELPKEP